MENYSYTNASYPDSGNSSPRSREIDFENPPPWEDQSSQPSLNYKVKFMCSYGGNITPRPHDNQLSYVGGETKILSVERNIKFAALIAKLSALCDTDVCFKYQLPGEDLDALISVTNDDDLEHMMHEYDRLFRGIAKPARLRLFLFAVNGRSETERPASTELKTDRERFVEALNSGHNSVDGSSPPANVLRGNSNVDYLFSVEKTGAALVTSPPLHPVVAPVAVVPVPVTQMRDERSVGADPVEIQRRIQELQRMQIGHEQQQNQNALYHQQQQQNRAADVINNNGRNGNLNVSTAYGGDYYKIPEQKLPVQNLPPNYWQENKQTPTSGGGYNDPPPPQLQQQQHVYMVPAGQGNVYHAPIRAQNPTQTTQSFYAPPQQQPQQQQQQQMYRDQQQAPVPQQQQMYNVVTSQPAAQPQPKLVQTYPPPEMVRQNMTESGGVGGGGYAQVAYDSSGRQVYYTAPGGVMQPQQTAYHPQQQQGIAVNPGHEGKVVITKVP